MRLLAGGRIPYPWNARLVPGFDVGYRLAELSIEYCTYVRLLFIGWCPMDQGLDIRGFSFGYRFGVDGYGMEGYG